MTTVLLFVEHELSAREVTKTLEELVNLRVGGEDQVDVTVLVPCPSLWSAALMDDLAATRGPRASRGLGARHDAAMAKASARQIMRHAESALRRAGHPARGELVAVREVVRDLVTEAVVRRATTALIVSSPHHLSHLLHRDLERRLRRAGIGNVIRVHGVDAAAAT
jgi:hypothetical protein